MDWALIPFYQCDADIDQNLNRSWTIGQAGRILFSAEDYTNMSYYNCCGIRPKHSDISKSVAGEGVFTICVVLDQSTVIFQKRGGGGGYYNLCGIEIKIVAMQCYVLSVGC